MDDKAKKLFGTLAIIAVLSTTLTLPISILIEQWYHAKELEIASIGFAISFALIGTLFSLMIKTIFFDK